MPTNARYSTICISVQTTCSAPLGPEEKVGESKRRWANLGFDLDLETPVGDLPLSIKQWITIARALLTDPKILILDESSAALDFDSTERLFRKMRELKRRGVASSWSAIVSPNWYASPIATVLREECMRSLQKEEITETGIFELIAGPERGKT